MNMFGTGYSPMNPYGGVVQNMQPDMRFQRPEIPQQKLSTPVIPGRPVDNPAEIRPNEVPMDGSASFFPTNDGKYIYAKCWNSNGEIITAKYVRDDTPEPARPNPQQDILDRLERIEKLVTPKKAANNKEG